MSNISELKIWILSFIFFYSMCSLIVAAFLDINLNHFSDNTKDIKLDRINNKINKFKN